ncbi:DUF7266 family protein [Natrinema longum]|uniref:Flagellin n=1 Tax=Natrinema longum TaxID=370324 RepID=A0A8A2U7W5_9EURY|nr:hypothetical protein [Natrinema longum]QSW84800.1 hypothetical protein J0X27_15315 [Natrinema longum]
MIARRAGRDRAVSITITHVLTIAITTILIAMLLTSASTMLDTETDRSTESSLETIGERLANEIGNVDQIAGASDDTVAMVADHPRKAAASGYTVELRTSCSASLLDGSTDCLILTANSADVVVYVPIKTDRPIADGSDAAGGPIEIRYDSTEISITEGPR